MRTFILVLAALTLTLPVAAQDDAIPLPKPRPVETAEPAAPEAAVAADGPTTPLPRPRPDPDAAKSGNAPAKEPAKTDEKPTEPIGPEKPDEPARIYQSACPAVISGQVEAEMLPPIAEGLCVARSPLALKSVLANGRMVPISGGVTTSCAMASTLPAWVASVDNYLAARDDTRIAEVVVSTSYMCRNVNNATSGNLSFHAFADAVDVMAFKLQDGRTVSIEDGWSDATSPEGRLLRFAQSSACSMFMTTLGPEADAQHADNLHIDMGCHGGRCVARLCE